MIPVSLSGFVFIYLLVFLAGIFTIWIAYEMVRRKREIDCLRRRIQCRLCGMEFEDQDTCNPVRCPRCSALTERSNHQPFI